MPLKPDYMQSMINNKPVKDLLYTRTHTHCELQVESHVDLPVRFYTYHHLQWPIDDQVLTQVGDKIWHHLYKNLA